MNEYYICVDKNEAQPPPTFVFDSQMLGTWIFLILCKWSPPHIVRTIRHMDLSLLDPFFLAFTATTSRDVWPSNKGGTGGWQACRGGGAPAERAPGTQTQSSLRGPKRVKSGIPGYHSCCYRGAHWGALPCAQCQQPKGKRQPGPRGSHPRGFWWELSPS